MYFYLMVGRISMICQDSDESGRRACQTMTNKKKARGSGEEGEGAGRRYRPPNNIIMTKSLFSWHREEHRDG